MTRADLKALAKRCESEPASFKLDDAIFEAMLNCGLHKLTFAQFTSSLDAAVSLVPEWLNWKLCFVQIGEHTTTPLASVELCGGLTNISTESSTPALALCAAALRVRADLEAA